MRTTQPSLLLCLLMLAPTLHAAGANKCVDANGNVTLTDLPCNSIATKPPPRPAGQARPPETLTPPKQEAILPPPGQQLPTPPAPLPASPPVSPPAVQPTPPMAPQTQPLQR